MDKKPAYSAFPPPKSPTAGPTTSTRSRQSIDRRRRSTSLDPLPPIEEPPDTPPVPELPPSDSAALKSIHSLHNPRPASRRTHSDHQRSPLQHQTSPQPLSVETDILPVRQSTLRRNPPSSSSEQHLPSPSRPHTSQEMHIPSPSTDSSLSLQKPPILSTNHHLSAKRPNPPQQKIAYFHGGIGGRGNYRKVVRETTHAPLAHARNVSPPGGRSARFLSSLFGGSRRRRSSPSGNSDELGAEGRTSQESFGSEEVSLGAAEVMRRKLLRQAGVKLKSNEQ